MQVTNKSIRDIIENIRQNDIILPALQREFVWKRRDIENLFDSMMQSYPINTMMFWKVDDVTQQKMEFYEFLDPDYQENNTTNRVYQAKTSASKTIVIDGQQRLTSLLIGIYGSYMTAKGKSKMFLYMCLDSPNKANASSEEDGMISTEMYYNFKFLSDSDAQRRNNSGEHWIKVGDAYNSSFVPASYALKNGLVENQWGIKAIQQLYDIFNANDLINYYEVKHNDLEDVLDIFVRTNNGGRKLTKGDLLLSMITAYWAAAQQDNAREYVQSIVNDCVYDVDKDWVLNCILYLLDKDCKLTVNQFDPKTSREIYNKKNELKSAIIQACQLVKRFGMHERGLTSKLALLPIAWHIYNFNLAGSINKLFKNGQPLSVTSGINQDMRTWLFRAIVKGFFTSGTNEKLNKIRGIQKAKSNINYFPLDEIANAVGLTITDKDIDELLATEKKTAFSLLNIIYSTMPYLTNNLNDTFEVDHVHPISQSNGNADFDQLPNLQLLTKAENNSKLATSLVKWWGAKGNNEKARYLLSPSFNTSLNNFVNFFNDRKQCFAEILANKLDVKNSAYIGRCIWAKKAL